MPKNFKQAFANNMETTLDTAFVTWRMGFLPTYCVLSLTEKTRGWKKLALSVSLLPLTLVSFGVTLVTTTLSTGVAAIVLAGGCAYSLYKGAEATFASNNTSSSLISTHPLPALTIPSSKER